MNKDISSSQFTQLFASLRQVVLKGKATFEAHFHILQIAPYSLLLYPFVMISNYLNPFLSTIILIVLTGFVMLNSSFIGL